MEDLVFHDSCHGNPYLHLLIKTILKWLQFHAKWQKIVPALGLICGFCVKDGIHPCTVQTKTKSCSLCVTIVWNWPIYLHGWSLVCDPLIWNSKFSGFCWYMLAAMLLPSSLQNYVGTKIIFTGENHFHSCWGCWLQQRISLLSSVYYNGTGIIFFSLYHDSNKVDRHLPITPLAARLAELKEWSLSIQSRMPSHSTQGLFLCSMLTSLVHYCMLFFAHVKCTVSW